MCLDWFSDGKVPQELAAKSQVSTRKLQAFNPNMRALRRHLLLLLLLVLGVAFQTLFPVEAALALEEERDELDSPSEPEIPECPPRFTRDYRPVCATNGRVYTNLSIFAYHRCRAAVLHGRTLQLQDMAACGARSPEL